MLQAAACHTRDPKGLRFDLVAPSACLPMETLVERAAPLDDERTMTSGLAALGLAIFDDVAVMERAVKAAAARCWPGLRAIRSAAWPSTPAPARAVRALRSSCTAAA